MYNEHQGYLRTALLELNYLKYVIDNYDAEKKHLVITCLDLIENEYRYTINGTIINHIDEESFVKGIKDYLGISKIFLSRTPYPEIEKF